MDSANAAVAALNGRFFTEYPVEAARQAEKLPSAELAPVYNALPLDTVLRSWRYLTPLVADELLMQLNQERRRELLLGLDMAECAQQLNRLRKVDRELCVELLPETERAALEQLLTYPERSAGRMMDSRILRFTGDDTAGYALTQLQRRRARKVRQIYVVNAEQHLQGVVDIQDLALGGHSQRLQQLMRPPRAIISPFDPIDQVAGTLAEHYLEMLPVLDVNGCLLGAIRHPMLVQSLRDESLTDMQAMVGVSREERALSSPWLAVRKRLLWMQVNLGTAFLAASVVGLFEATIAQFTALAVLLPVVAGQSGNAGAQALAVTMRGLALREITVAHALRILLKEVAVGATNGAAVALTTAIGVYVWSGSAGLAMVIGIAMVMSMTIACCAGAMVPIILTRLRQDPAQSASIVLTTVTDVAGFFSFLGIATALSHLL